MPVYRIPIELHNTSFPSTMVNVFHGRADDSGALGGASQLAGTMLGALQTFYTALAPNFAAGTVVRFPTAIVDVDSQEETPIQTINDITTVSGTQAPHGLSICVSWRTSLRARRGRGRSFIGPLQSAIMDDATGKPYSGNRDLIVAAVNDLIGESTAVNGWALGVYGQENAGVATPKVLRDFIAGDVSNEFSLLRSRRD